MEVTGRFYRAMSAGRSEIASVSSLYADEAVRQTPLCFSTLGTSIAGGDQGQKCLLLPVRLVSMSSQVFDRI